MSNVIVETVEYLNGQRLTLPDKSSLKSGNSHTCIKRNLVSIWLINEHSKLYCKWVNE